MPAEGQRYRSRPVFCIVSKVDQVILPPEGIDIPAAANSYGRPDAFRRNGQLLRGPGSRQPLQPQETASILSSPERQLSLSACEVRALEGLRFD